MKRLLFVFFILPLLTTCELFDNDMPAFLDFYSGTAKIENHLVDGSHLIGSNNKVNISPESARTITFTLNNPQKYDLNLGINWNNSLLTRTTAEPPVQDPDYTLVQNPNDKSLIHLTFTKELLNKTDKAVDGGDISATISLTESKSGRKFESYDYKLESNSPPPPFKDNTFFLMKDKDDKDGKYVICFQLPHVTDADPTHQDIITLRIKNNSGTTSFLDYPIDLTGGNRGNDAVSHDGSNIIDGNNLFPVAPSESKLPSGYDTDGVFYRTDLTAGSPIDYTITLTDTEGLHSEVVMSSVLPDIGVTIDVTIKEESGTVLSADKYYTKNDDVTLRLSAVIDDGSGVTGYLIKNKNAYPSADDTWTSWNGDNTESHAHNLDEPTVGGLKTIYVWVKNNVGNVSFPPTEVEVTLVKTAPTFVVTIIEESGTVLSGIKYYTKNDNVTLELSAVADVGNGVTGYLITNTSASPSVHATWISWSGYNSVSSAHTLGKLNTDEEKTIHVWLKDNVGNVSNANKVKVTLDRVPPRITRVTIGGKVVTNNKVDISDALTRALSITSDSRPVAYQITAIASAPTSWVNSIPSRAFAHKETIYIWAKDLVGNVSEAFPVTITNRVVYLNPFSSSGNGTVSSPVRTMDEAIHLLGGLDSLASGAAIWVMGTINITTDTAWHARTPLTLKRYRLHAGYLVEIRSKYTLTLENIIVAGEKESGLTQKALIYVSPQSVLNIGNGVILRMNHSNLKGGGVYVHDGTLNMSGNAAITGNSTNLEGGGVYIHGSNGDYGTLNMSEDALISENVGYNSGGGVYVRGHRTFIMGGNAAITGNATNLEGGGVYVENGPFIMSGNALISSNSTNGEGGGVYVSYSKFSMHGDAVIIDNEARNGGGVYNTSSVVSMAGHAKIMLNTAIRGGGGVYNDGKMTTHTDIGTVLYMHENAKIFTNTAYFTGGGVVWTRDAFAIIYLENYIFTNRYLNTAHIDDLKL